MLSTSSGLTCSGSTCSGSTTSGWSGLLLLGMPGMLYWLVGPLGLVGTVLIIIVGGVVGGNPFLSITMIQIIK